MGREQVSLLAVCAGSRTAVGYVTLGSSLTDRARRIHGVCPCMCVVLSVDYDNGQYPELILRTFYDSSAEESVSGAEGGGVQVEELEAQYTRLPLLDCEYLLDEVHLDHSASIMVGKERKNSICVVASGRTVYIALRDRYVSL